MKSIISNGCGTETIFHNGKLLGPIIVALNHSDDIDDYILIGEKDNIGNNYWYISLTNPEYIEIHGNIMNQSEKDEFINIITNNWNIIIDELEKGCKDLCGEDCYKCNHYKNRKISSIPLDYTLLN